MRAVSLLLALAVALPAAAQEGKVEVALSTREVTVGDRIEANLALFWDGPAPTGEPEFPSLKTWGQAEVLSAGPVRATQEAGQKVWRQTLALTSFEIGEVVLPPVEIAVPVAGATRKLATPEDLGFKVASVLPEKPEEPLEPRPAAAPLPIGSSTRFWGVTVVLAGLCALCSMLLLRRLEHAPAEPARAPLEPLEELLERLRQLSPAGSGEPVHTGLSLALRGYLGRTLAIGARESTTSEIQRQLRHAPVPTTAAQQTVRLLRDCDQVKFGRLEVPASVSQERLETARTLATEIEACVRPAEVRPAPEPTSAGKAVT